MSTICEENEWILLFDQTTDKQTERQKQNTFYTPASERGYTALPLCAGLSDVCLSVTNDILLSNYELQILEILKQSLFSYAIGWDSSLYHEISC